jgi:histidine triad (HIT) family protein
MSSCLFCQIANKEISTNIVLENEHLVAFNDIHPKAPVHILLIPKKHLKNINHLTAKESKIITSLILSAKQLAKKNKIDQTGFRLVFNTKGHSGQEVDHLHLHLLGGKKLGPMA